MLFILSFMPLVTGELWYDDSYEAIFDACCPDPTPWL